MFSEAVRGGIHHLERYKQLIDYSGMQRHRRITPTDIDGFIDYAGNAFVYLDAKLEGKDLSTGQRIAYEHIVNSHSKAKNVACAIIFRHNVPADEMILAHEKYVDTYYLGDGWKTPSEENTTLLRFIEKLETYWKSNGVKL